MHGIGCWDSFRQIPQSKNIGYDMWWMRLHDTMQPHPPHVIPNKNDRPFVVSIDKVGYTMEVQTNTYILQQ